MNKYILSLMAALSVATGAQAVCPCYNSMQQFDGAQLMQACVDGDLTAVCDQLDANPANYKDAWNRTPLMRAAQYGHYDIVYELIQSGANLDAQDYRGDTALKWACYNSDYYIAKLLLNHGANLYLKDNQGCTALLDAIRTGRYAIVELLLQRGANPMDSIVEFDARGYGYSISAITLASGYYFDDIVYLLERYGARPPMIYKSC